MSPRPTTSPATWESPEGDLAVTTGASGTVTLQLTSLHGDVMATVPVDPAAGTITGAVTVLDSDEFGMPSAETPAAATARYGWLGGKQRSAEALGGVVLMGVRVYDPGTGRFWQPDPEPGGNATAYDYCAGDPVNCTDLDGRWGFGSVFKAVCNTVAKVAEVASYIPGPIGSIAAGVSAVAYAGAGNWSKAAEMAITVGAALIGATLAVKAVVKVVKVAAKVAPKVSGRVAKSGRAAATKALTYVRSFTKGGPGRITGYTRHGLNQAIGRNDGRGVNIGAMRDAVRQPKRVVKQSGGRTKYDGKKASVVLSRTGRVITTFGKARGPKPDVRRSSRGRRL